MFVVLGLSVQVGMRHFHLLRNHEYCPTVNVDRLWSLLSEKAFENAKKGMGGKAYVVDCTQAGYFKASPGVHTPPRKPQAHQVIEVFLGFRGGLGFV